MVRSFALLMFSGSFVLLDGKTWKLKGVWGDKNVKYGYDFWYQYRDNTLISTEWGKPSTWWKGFDPSLLKSGMLLGLLHFKVFYCMYISIEQ